MRSNPRRSDYITVLVASTVSSIMKEYSGPPRCSVTGPARWWALAPLPDKPRRGDEHSPLVAIRPQRRLGVGDALGQKRAGLLLA